MMLRVLIFSITIGLVSCKNPVEKQKIVKYPEVLYLSMASGCSDSLICLVPSRPEFFHYITYDSTSTSIIDSNLGWITKRQFDSANFLIGLAKTSDVHEDYGIKYSWESGFLVAKWFSVIGHNWPVDSISDTAEYITAYKLDEHHRIRVAIDSSNARYLLYTYDSVARISKVATFSWGLPEPFLINVMTHQYASDGKLQQVEITNANNLVIERYCFEAGTLRQIQHENYSEECMYGN